MQELVLYELQDSQYGAAVFNQVKTTPLYVAFVMPFPQSTNEFTESPPQTVIAQSFIGYSNELLVLDNNTDLTKFQYIGVSQYFCTQSFSTTVKEGISNTTELAYTNKIISSTTTDSVNAMWNAALFEQVCDPGPLTGTTITLGGPAGLSNETYLIDVCTATYFSEVYLTGISGGIALNLEREVDETIGQIEQALGIAIYGEFNIPGIPDPETQYANVKTMMENIGRSFTS
jgi:hypothetical protein